MKDRITDILLRRIDSYINPKIENRVIYCTLMCGATLILGPKILGLISGISIKSGSWEIAFENSQLDNFSIVIGCILISIAALALYLFKIHKRPEFVIESDSPSAMAVEELWIFLSASDTHKPTIVERFDRLDF